MKHLVISFVAADKPGLVDTLSNIVSKHKGNWQSSSMHQLSGFFAGVIEVAVSDDAASPLCNALNELEDFDTTIKVAADKVSTQSANLVLELTANDRAGIIQEISSVIHQQGGNLIKLVSTQEGAAHSGHDLFKSKATIAVAETRIDTLVEALEHLADDLMVDISK